jgi:quercetin dioxygenase-like cupin family protein
MTHQSGGIPPEPARRTPGHEQASERLSRKLAHIDLEAEIALLRSEEGYARVGRSAKTLVKRPDMRVVLTAMSEGARVTEHIAPGPLTVEVLQGRLRMQLADGNVELPAGHLLALDRNERHDVEALEKSAFLLTIAWPPEP